jgi:SAM-dependent methyltransferase
MTEPSLTSAYDLSGADACLRLYADWAKSYDQSFAAAMDYRLPAHVAAACMAAGPPSGAVLDVGAGTGLCAAALRAQGFEGPIDAVDLSQEMLDTASTKGLYRALYRADITRPLAVPGGYAALVSSGTFTSGHVGPQALPPLLDVTAPGGVLVLSVNLRVWDGLGFEAAIDALGGRIGPPRWLDVTIYGAAAAERDPDHAQDRARIVILRRI